MNKSKSQIAEEILIAQNRTKWWVLVDNHGGLVNCCEVHMLDEETIREKVIELNNRDYDKYVWSWNNDSLKAIRDGGADNGEDYTDYALDDGFWMYYEPEFVTST